MRLSKLDVTAAARDLISAAVVNALAPVPTEPGAYLLIMETSDPVPLEIRPLATAGLPAGRYAYAGSACGPGGIRARVIRHLKADKKRHWHIDHLTAVAPPIEVIAFPGRNECDILAEILARPGVSIPVPGFGSSDCRNCPAHLVRLA
jgi:Uri superfamily endonuclease